MGALEFVDANTDGMVSLEEYQNDYKKPEHKDVGHLDVNEEADVFKALDLNNNNYLDGDELSLWIQADNGEIAVDEAEHLMETADSDEDGKLSMQEVIDAVDDFIESDATEYGNMLRFHDEL